jgi:hypothetical protein
MEEQQQQPTTEQAAGRPLETGQTTPVDDPAELRAKLAQLEDSLAMRREELDGLENGKKALEARLQGLSTSLAAAVSAYRALVVTSNPDILPELITGDTIERVGESLKKARALVDRIRQDVEAGISAGRFPAGSPERGTVEPDLSPREKIERGIGRPK